MYYLNPDLSYAYSVSVIFLSFPSTPGIFFFFTEVVKVHMPGNSCGFCLLSPSFSWAAYGECYYEDTHFIQPKRLTMLIVDASVCTSSPIYLYLSIPWHDEYHDDSTLAQRRSHRSGDRCQISHGGPPGRLSALPKNEN